MLASLALAILALRAGLAMRKRRTRGLGPKSGLMRRHLALAKPAVGLVLVGFGGGVVSAVMLRSWEPFDSLHGLVGLVVAALFALTGYAGQRAARGRGGAGTHGLLGLSAVLLAALTAFAGFVLLP
jgi:hypothetical protein